MIEVILNDRLGKKVRVKCKYVEDLDDALPLGAGPVRSPLVLILLHQQRVGFLSLAFTHIHAAFAFDPLFCMFIHSEDDTVGDLKKLVAAHIGTRPEKIRIQKWYIIYKVRACVCVCVCVCARAFLLL